MNNKDVIKRLSVIVSHEHFEKISKLGINISTFIRGLIDDYFNDTKISISVSPKTFKLYSDVIEGSGASDRDLEPYIRDILKKVLDDRLDKLQKLKKKL